MDKQEILAKSLEDNGITDERERQIGMRGGYIATVVMFIAAIALFVFKFAIGQPTGDVQFFAFSGMSAMFIYQYMIRREITLLVFAVVATLGTIGFLVSYLMQVLPVFIA